MLHTIRSLEKAREEHRSKRNHLNSLVNNFSVWMHKMSTSINADLQLCGIFTNSVDRLLGRTSLKMDSS